MKAKEIGKWLLMGLQWGTGFYIFSIIGIYLATEWGRSPLFARRATVAGYIFYILITIILVLLAAVWRAGREKKPAKGILSRLLLWSGLSLPASTVAFALSALCLYLAGLVVGAKMPGLGGVNWIGAWLVALVLALLKVILTIGASPCGREAPPDNPAPGPE
jgi:hypothetical protein